MANKTIVPLHRPQNTFRKTSLILYKSFIRHHLDYGETYNTKLHQNFESIQKNSALGITGALHLDQTHFDVVRRLIYLRGFTQYVRKESSSQRHNYFRAEQTDLLYAYAKYLIQTRRIQISVASLSLVSFCSMPAFHGSRLISYINIYYLFAGAIYHIVFSPVCWLAGVFLFGGEI